jgi:ABC-type nitrate/sulfonate/bicarbonate transport system ATPase subunit
LHILSGLLPCDKGEISVNGAPLKGISGKFAYMPQEDLLMPWKTILENVCISGVIRGLPKKELRQNALDHFGSFGLLGYDRRYPRQLSGGMRQRAAFLRTVLCDAEIMLLDEPFGALDAITRTEMRLWLAELRQKLRQTILLVTHDIEEAIFLADRIYLLGRKVTVVMEEIAIQTPPEERDREWLLRESELKLKIYTALAQGGATCL